MSSLSVMAAAGAGPKRGQSSQQHSRSRPAQAPQTDASVADASESTAPQQTDESKQADFLDRLSQNIHDPEMSEKLGAIAEEIKTSGDLSESDRAYLTNLASRLSNPKVAGALRQIAQGQPKAVDSTNEGSWQTPQAKDSNFVRTLSKNLNNPSMSERLDAIAEEIAAAGVLSEDDRAYLTNLSKRIKNQKVSDVLGQIADKY